MKATVRYNIQTVDFVSIVTIAEYITRQKNNYDYNQ